MRHEPADPALWGLDENGCKSCQETHKSIHEEEKTPLVEKVYQFLMDVYPDATARDMVDIHRIIGKLLDQKTGYIKNQFLWGIRIYTPDQFYKGYWVGYK